MNERIRQLLKQATTDVNPQDREWVFSRVDQAKFAELIIKECMDLASKEQKRYASITHRNMSECAVALGNFSLLMKDHFEDEQ
jgi:hypothetical protein